GSAGGLDRGARFGHAVERRVLHEAGRSHIDATGGYGPAPREAAARVPAVAARPERAARGEWEGPCGRASGRRSDPASEGRSGVARADRAATRANGRRLMTPVLEARQLAKTYESSTAKVLALRGVDI